ncbi:unnamed protein product [Owenia fusiformis]|uniref:Anaphase-promoting complex subunit 4 C-terminal half WD40 domain-containing protein n=1 Tax=Owenia fusiformis TaxID=6347 RepID=A0A8S4NSJ1_OWEFU|nr:unnamed protein product [Owenia fusiformis]
MVALDGIAYCKDTGIGKSPRLVLSQYGDVSFSAFNTVLFCMQEVHSMRVRSSVGLILAESLYGSRNYQITVLLLLLTKKSVLQTQSCDRHQILDVSFYDESTISFLLLETTEDGLGVLIQFPLGDIPETMWTPLVDGLDYAIERKDVQTLDGGTCLEGSQLRRLENMKPLSLAVSGTRNSACVLFSSRRRVRLFLMDAEDDDDDEDDDDLNSTTQTNQNDDSIQPMDDEDKENSSFETTS